MTEETDGEVIAIDGKTAKGSRDHKNKRNPLNRVSAWACSNRLVPGQQATDEKSNEIKAIPKLLALLELKGCLVTIDAMGCQRDIAEQMIDQEGGYILGLKGNQGNLHEAIEDFFTTAKPNQFAGVVHPQAFILIGLLRTGVDIKMLDAQKELFKCERRFILS